MKKLKAHIGLTVIYATLLVLFILIGLQIFITFVAQLGDLGQGDYGVVQALYYVFWSLPNNIYQFFPMVGLMGSLLGLGYLASNNELVVMRTSGVSVWQVIWSVLRAAIFLLIIMTIIGEWLGPSAMHQATINKSIARSGGQMVSTQHGMWIRKGKTFIHVKSVVSNHQLLGVSQYQFHNGNQLQVASYAKSAAYKNGQWYLNNLTQTFLKKRSTQVKQIQQQLWPIQLKPSLFQLSSDDAQEISLARLKYIIRYRQKNGLQAQSYALAYWERLFQPLSTLVMILLGIPFVFGPLRSVSMGLRLLAGITISFLFYLLNRFFGSISLVYQIPPFIGALLPSCVFGFIGFWFMRRVR